MARATMLTANRVAAARLIARNAGNQEVCDLLMEALAKTTRAGAQGEWASLRGRLQAAAAQSGEPPGSPLMVAIADLRESLIEDEPQGVNIRGR